MGSSKRWSFGEIKTHIANKNPMSFILLLLGGPKWVRKCFFGGGGGQGAGGEGNFLGEAYGA